MNEYYCQYKTKSGQRCGEVICAWTALDARKIIECRPEFAYHYNYPEKLNQEYIMSLLFWVILGYVIFDGYDDII